MNSSELLDLPGFAGLAAVATAYTANTACIAHAGILYQARWSRNGPH
ncbi:hypothetical protein [Lapillicoccus sp.]|nr:hypothetical protein [Lapillicoccus sp.]